MISPQVKHATESAKYRKAAYLSYHDEINGVFLGAQELERIIEAEATQRMPINLHYFVAPTQKAISEGRRAEPMFYKLFSFLPCFI